MISEVFSNLDDSYDSYDSLLDFAKCFICEGKR